MDLTDSQTYMKNPLMVSETMGDMQDPKRHVLEFWSVQVGLNESGQALKFIPGYLLPGNIWFYNYIIPWCAQLLLEDMETPWPLKSFNFYNCPQ